MQWNIWKTRNLYKQTMPRYFKIDISTDMKYFMLPHLCWKYWWQLPSYVSDSKGQRCVPDRNSENYNSGITSQWCQDRSDQGYCSNPCKIAEQDLFTREDLLSDTNGSFSLIYTKTDFRWWLNRIAFIIAQLIFTDFEDDDYSSRALKESQTSISSDTKCYACGKLGFDECKEFDTHNQEQIKKCSKHEVCLLYSWKKSSRGDIGRCVS